MTLSLQRIADTPASTASTASTAIKRRAANLGGGWVSNASLDGKRIAELSSGG